MYNGVVLVGALSNYGVEDSGAVYVFTGHRDKWSQQTKLTSPNKGITEDQFGRSISIGCPNMMVVGARNNDDQGHNSGNAYVVQLCG